MEVRHIFSQERHKTVAIRHLFTLNGKKTENNATGENEFLNKPEEIGKYKEKWLKCLKL